MVLKRFPGSTRGAGIRVDGRLAFQLPPDGLQLVLESVFHMKSPSSWAFGAADGKGHVPSHPPPTYLVQLKGYISLGCFFRHSCLIETKADHLLDLPVFMMCV